MTTNYIGQPIDRVDGHAKVTGQAKYAAEYNVPNLAYGVVISSTIAKGRITNIDTSEALGLSGVLEVFTHENAPRTASDERSYKDEVVPPGKPFRPLHDDKIMFSGQPIGLVVADTFELARYAASLVHVACKAEPHETDLTAMWDRAYDPKAREYIDPPIKPRGDAGKAFAKAAVKLE